MDENNLKYSAKCIQYEGECLEYVRACKGEDLEQIVININSYLKFLLEAIQSNILIENVGEGEKLFKGKVGDILPSYQFRSLLETDSINLGLKQDEISFSVNENWLTSYISNFSTNVTSPKNTILTDVLDNVITVDLNTSIFKSEKEFLKILPQQDGTIKWDIDIPTNITSVDNSVNVGKNGYVFDLSVPAQKQQVSSDESITITEGGTNKDFVVKNNLISASDSYVKVEDSLVDGKRQIKIGIDIEKITLGSAQYGFIQDFYGNVNTIPRGWYICDGTNGTPDLRGMFIVGYDDRDIEYSEVGKTGGLKNVTLTESQIPPHKHSGSTNESGEHTHRYSLITWGGYDSWNRGSNADSRAKGTTEPSGKHSHTLETTNTGGGQSHENRPPFYTLLKIMFKGG